MRRNVKMHFLTYSHAGSINECGNEREEILFDATMHEWLICDGFASRSAMTRCSIYRENFAIRLLTANSD